MATMEQPPLDQWAAGHRSDKALPSEGTPMAAAHSRLARLREVLDPIFGQAGLAPAPESGKTSLTYQGTVDGRSLRATCSVRTNHRHQSSTISFRQFAGLNLEIVVATPLKTRLTVSPPLGVSLAGADNLVVRAVIRAAELWRPNSNELMRVPFEDHGDFGVRTRAADSGWAGDFLDAEVRRVLWDLLPPRNLGVLGPVNQWSLAFLPGEGRLSLTPVASSFTSPNLIRWLQRAIWLVEQAEQRQPAELAETAPRIGEASPADARRIVLPKILGALGCIALLPFLLLALFLVGYLLVGEWVMLVPIVFAFFFMPYAMFLLVRNRARSMAWSRRMVREPHWSQPNDSETELV